MYWAFLGISMPSAFSTERTEASAWTDVQTPQKRWVNIHASLGSFPWRITSKPRHIWPEDQAFVTLPPSTSQSIRRCPSIRVTGSITIFGFIARCQVTDGAGHDQRPDKPGDFHDVIPGQFRVGLGGYIGIESELVK